MIRYRDPNSWTFVGWLLWWVLLLLVVFLWPALAQACSRSHSQHMKFRSTHPCPVTGQVKGACPGFVVDHVIALCKGGPDRSTNMQWQSVADAKAKDRIECK